MRGYNCLEVKVINNSLTTIGNICDSMIDLQGRRAVVDLLTIRHFIEAEIDKIEYYNDILITIYDVPDYLDSTSFNSLMKLYDTVYSETKVRMAKLKAEGCN